MEIQKQRIIEILKEWGNRILVEDDAHINFLFQMDTVACMLDSEEETFYNVGLTNFFEFKDEDEAEVLKLCNEVNKTKKVVKAYTLEDNRVLASAEFYCYDPKDLPEMLKTALKSLVSVKLFFAEAARNSGK